MPSTVAIFWPLRRAQYSAGPAVESPLKVLKPATTLLIFGQFPNIWGQVGSGFLRGGPNTDYGLGAFSYISTSETKVASGDYFLATVFDFDASRQSPLYQSGTTEVKVNGLLGLHLIKAF